MRPTRDDIYLTMAELIARRATCVRRSVGCVLVDEHGVILSTGYNGVASGRPHCNEGFPCSGSKAPSGQGLEGCEAIHAEQNAILRLSNPLRVDTAYCTTFPCHSCIKLLLGTSCRRIVFKDDYPHSEAKAWWAEAGREIVQLK